MKPRIKALAPRLAALDARTAKPAQPITKPIYLSAEHRAWRAAVLNKAGHRCQYPGCGRSGIRLFADHIVELSDGGAPSDPANGQALCGSHHTLKTAAERAKRTAKDWRF